MYIPVNESKEKNSVSLLYVTIPTTTSAPASNAFGMTPFMNNTKTSSTTVTITITILHAIVIIIVIMARTTSQSQEHSASYTQ